MRRFQKRNLFVFSEIRRRPKINFSTCPLAWTQIRPWVGARALALRARITNHKDLLLYGRSSPARRFSDLVTVFIADMGGLDCCRRSG